MRTIIRLEILLVTLSFWAIRGLARQVIFNEPLSPRIANYVISAKLDADQKMIFGKEKLTWRNATNDIIRELQFHLYLNAFKNSESTFMKESGGAARGFAAVERGWGWIEVTSMKMADGEDLMQGIEFIHPDDDNERDQTVISVPLARPVRPRRSLEVEIEFTAKLPRVFERSGYYQDYFFVAQWFPKIGVYEAAGQRYAARGQWNCHQYHANGEFYADYGVYDVDITVPSSHVVGATGLQQSLKENGDGTKTVAYRAEDVHDFVWTSFPHFVDLSDRWRHVAIRVLMQPQRVHQAPRYFESAKAALEYFDKYVGLYSYPNLTIVDPAYGGTGSGGMEYPTLITSMSFWGIGPALKFAEQVTVHEFGHQYWYGLVGNNEFEEAWLDEGINSYYELRIMTHAYGERASVLDLPGFKVGDVEAYRTSYTGMRNPKIAPVQTNAWEFKQGGYGNLSYHKAAMFLMTLDRMVGRAVMDTIMTTYFRRWKFKHPCARDFIAVVNEVVPRYHGNRFGRDLNWFFDQVLYGTEVCDYAVRFIQNNEVRPARGVFDQNRKKVTVGAQQDTMRPTLHDARVVVIRLGEVKMPTSVLVHFDNGREVRESWDGQNRWAEFNYRGPEKIAWAVVDPDTVLMIDVNWMNNSCTTEPTTGPIWKYTLKFLFWLQNVLQLAAVVG